MQYAIAILFLLSLTAPLHGLTDQPQNQPEVIERKALVLAGARETLAYDEMAERLPIMIEDIYSKLYSVRPAAGQGPLIIIYQTPVKDDAPEDAAIITAGLKLARGIDRDRLHEGIAAFDYPKMRTMTKTYTGDVAGLEAAWALLAKQAKAAGEKPADHRREIYRKWVATDSKKNVVELILGLKDQEKQDEQQQDESNKSSPKNLRSR